MSNEEIYFLFAARSKSKDRTNVRSLPVKMTLLFALSGACGPGFYQNLWRYDMSRLDFRVHTMNDKQKINNEQKKARALWSGQRPLDQVNKREGAFL